MSGPLRKSMDPECEFTSPFSHGRIDEGYQNLKVKLLSWPDEHQFGIMATIASSGHAGAKIDLENFTVDELAMEDTWKGFNLGQIKEFGKLVFLVTGCSRSFTHEIVRTRIGAAYIQQTMRHTNMGNPDVRMPEAFLHPKNMKQEMAIVLWEQLQKESQQVYQELVNADFAYQDARTACTLGTETWIIISYDVRTWLDTYAQRRCLAADSVIHTVSGDKTISELYLGLDEQFDVYSVNENGDLDIGNAYRPVKTGIKQLYKLIFDTGDTIRLTADHRVMMRDGSYKEVKDLSLGDSIMPFNRKYKDGYPIIYEHIDNGMIAAHKFTVLKKDGIRLPLFKVIKRDDSLVIHHINFDKNDNSRENLMVMTSYDHIIYHATIEHAPITDEGRKRISDRMKKNNPMKNSEIAERVHAQRRGMKMPEQAERMKINNPYFNPETLAKAKANGLGKTKDPKADAAKRMKNPNVVANLFKPGQKPWNTGLTKKSDKRLEKLGPGKGKFNHKVISIELDSIEDVYDIQVDLFHNFAANGIFIHNCNMFYPEMVEIMKKMKEAVEEKALWIADQAKIACERLQPDGTHKCTYQGAEIVEGWCEFEWAKEDNRLFKSVRFKK